MTLMTLPDRPEAFERFPSLRETVAMPSPRSSADRARMEDRVLRYAPLLRFSVHETHHPIDPARFVEHARLRRYGWSEKFRDAIWHAGRACWEACLDDVPATAGGAHPDISDVCRLIQVEARGGADGRNRRPTDAANMWYGRRAGYALELVAPLAAELRGTPGGAPCLFYDRYAVPTPSGTFDVISYWFFFALSPSAHPHEGDWQSVSVIIPEKGTELPHVQYGSSRQGVTCGFAEAEVVDGTHPVAWVEPGSHRMQRMAEDLDGPHAGHSVLLRSWELEPRRVPTLPWSSFDGAWGRVGTGPRTTGPLGPLFQREVSSAPQA